MAAGQECVTLLVLPVSAFSHASQLHTSHESVVFTSKDASDTRFPAGLRYSWFSFSAEGVFGSMFIKCYAYPSV